MGKWICEDEEGHSELWKYWKETSKHYDTESVTGHTEISYGKVKYYTKAGEDA